jgi:rhodanese-related sulfurtransferase
MIPFEITVDELKEWRETGKEHILIDVREPAEKAHSDIGGKLVPLNTLPQHMGELDPEAEIVVYCHVGGRSAMATQFLRQNGFPNARNLKGGIDAWERKKYPLVS